MSEREAVLRAFHAASPGVTSRGLARTGVYERFAARIPPGGRVLDLACGDGTLLRHLGPGAVGLDVARAELAAASGPVVQGRAQALPFVDAAFDAVTCQLAFMLFDDVERVIAELARVLAPGGAFIALLGGGPAADDPHDDDAFHRFLALLAPHAVSAGFGDPRARSERGWRALFAGWGAVAFERWELDAGGTFDEVWTFLGASYQLPVAQAPTIAAALAASYPAGSRIPCRVVTWVARVTRPVAI